jgi:hypothetical protein
VPYRSDWPRDFVSEEQFRRLDAEITRADCDRELEQERSRPVHDEEDVDDRRKEEGDWRKGAECEKRVFCPDATKPGQRQLRLCSFSA